uniref:Uncharacterized protein n=1 Tax=uncultured bacterium contig00069 TaxID=1181550 RepID=A0A806KIM3_9BACT|nr:hypothetical protein [uncultured bacterium contig00069]
MHGAKVNAFNLFETLDEEDIEIARISHPANSINSGKF